MKMKWRALLAACAAGALGWTSPAWAEEREGDPLAGQRVLDRGALVRAVLERNPDIHMMALGADVARAKVGQAKAWMDPMLRLEVAPLSLVSQHHRKGVVVGVEQTIPLFGRRGTEGERARAEVEGAEADADTMRLRMAQEASSMFDDWYLVHRTVEVIDHHIHRMREVKRSAELQYGVGMGSQQDPLQAEVELARMERERLMLDAEKEMIRAQLNAMLRRDPDLPLPPPPSVLSDEGVAFGDRAALRAEALQKRPELKALRARLGGSEAMEKLARTSWLPEVGVMAEYNTMWDAPEHQVMAGVMINIPIQTGMRRSMSEEARADVARMRAEERARVDQIVAEVDVALARVNEARAALKLHGERLVPAARHQLAAARVAFESGRREFMALMEAENNLHELRLGQHAAEAELHRRIAQLNRAVGRLP